MRTKDKEGPKQGGREKGRKVAGDSRKKGNVEEAREGLDR